MASISVKLFLRTLLIISLACSVSTKSTVNITIIVIKAVLTLKLYSYPVGNGLDSASPQCLVELGV